MRYIVLLLGFSILAGCAEHKNPLIGEWVITSAEGKPGMSDYRSELILKSDGVAIAKTIPPQDEGWSAEGGWSQLDSNHLQLEFPETAGPHTWRFSLKGNILILDEGNSGVSGEIHLKRLNNPIKDGGEPNKPLQATSL